jgi:hypothetical protein
MKNGLISSPSKWKTLLGTLWDGRKVYMVSGQHVRDHFFADFTEGGNFTADPWIPENEIWVEDLQTPDDLVESLIHEVIENTLMDYDIIRKYDPAHSATNTVSQLVRKIRCVNQGSIKEISKRVTYPMDKAPQAPKGEATLASLLNGH